MTKRLHEPGPFWTYHGTTQVRHRTKLGALRTSQYEYRAARPAPGEPLATTADDVQLRRDVPEGRQLGRLKFQGNQRLDRRRVSVE
jgi:hypothetical protein